MKEPQQISTPTATINLSGLQNDRAKDSITLVEAFGLLWKKRILLLAFALVGAVVGIFVGNWTRPMYSSDALLKLDVKGNKTGRALGGEMGMLLDMSSPADAEIEMIKSRMVLGYVVDAEGLCFNATPIGFMDRLMHREGRMDIASLVLPAEKRGGWKAEIINDKEYRLYSPAGESVLRGVVGIEAKAEFEDDSVSILVNNLKGKPGQSFKLGVMPALNAARILGGSLNIAEKGKQTGVISIRYTHRYPDRAEAILNSVANVYVRQNIEMRSAEAEKTLAFLENQLPGVKAKLDSAEQKLADYRHRIGSVDMSGETQALLKKEQDLNMQILSLEQKRQELSRLFKNEHSSVQTVSRQLAKVRKELSKLKTSAEKMPLTQQEVLSLQEEVAVNNAQYTSMLNNIQQLRVVKAGEVGTVRVVDYAVLDSNPVKPKKFRILLASILAFLMIGVVLVFLLRILKNGARNALEIERETGIGVYAKIPESKDRNLKRYSPKRSLPIVSSAPEDPASEALRSLFTAVEFSATAEKPVIMVAGLVAGVGKSFVAKNLAALYANSGKKTLLIDADMRRGVVHSKKHLGLAELLAGKSNLDECVSSTDMDDLFTLGAGNALQSPTDLLHGDKLKKLLQNAKEKFDAVIIDTPPISLVADTELIIPCVDFSLYVLHYGRHSIDQIKEAMNKAERLGETPKAFAINHCEREMSMHYYGGYGYYGYRKR